MSGWHWYEVHGYGTEKNEDQREGGEEDERLAGLWSSMSSSNTERPKSASEHEEQAKAKR